MAGKHGLHICGHSFAPSVFKLDYFKKFVIITHNDQVIIIVTFNVNKFNMNQALATNLLELLSDLMVLLDSWFLRLKLYMNDI